MNKLVTQNEFLAIAKSKLNQRVTVDTNHYGGQCVAYIDACIREATNGAKNMAYTNAVDGLTKAKQLGYEVFTTGAPQPGDVYVIATSLAKQGHTFGHIGICLDAKEDQYIIGLEQNVDGNADALTNGGWVRQVNNTWGSDGSLYNNYIHYPSGYLIGWFRPWSGVPNGNNTSTPKKGKIKMEELLHVQDNIDGTFSKGAIFLMNYAQGTYKHLNEQEFIYVKESYRRRYGEEIKQVETKKDAPVHLRLIAAYSLKQV